jgi:hypothetical protein
MAARCGSEMWQREMTDIGRARAREEVAARMEKIVLAI